VPRVAQVLHALPLPDALLDVLPLPDALLDVLPLPDALLDVLPLPDAQRRDSRRALARPCDLVPLPA
jgi:hypothetical protein